MYAHDEGRVVDHLRGLRRVVAVDAQVKDEGKAEQDAQGAHQVPGLAAAVPAEPPVKAPVALDADERRGNAVGHLTHQHQRAGGAAFEAIDQLHKNQQVGEPTIKRGNKSDEYCCPFVPLSPFLTKTYQNPAHRSLKTWPTEKASLCGRDK